MTQAWLDADSILLAHLRRKAQDKGELGIRDLGKQGSGEHVHACFNSCRDRPLVGISLLPACTVAVWDGYFPLTVTVVSDYEQTIESISYADANRQFVADALAKISNTEHDQEFRAVEDWDGQSFTARIPSSGRRDQFGIEHQYWHSPFVVIWVQFEDGSSRRIAAEIPKGRGARGMTIKLSKDDLDLWQ